MKKVVAILCCLFISGNLLAQNLPQGIAQQHEVGSVSQGASGHSPVDFSTAVGMLGSAGKTEEAVEVTPSGVTLYNPGSRQGYVDSMSVKENVDSANLGLKGQVNLYMTGVSMTEPAVLAGFAAANEYSNQQLQRSYLTYQMMKEVAENSELESARIELVRFSNCLAKTSASKNHDIAGAIDACQRTEAAKESEVTSEVPRERGTYGMNGEE